VLTQDRLKEVLRYNRKTGLFTNRIPRGRLRVGAVVGHPDRLGYLHCTIDGESHLMHRLAWLYVYGYFPEELDHRDEVKGNNAIRNLRLCTRAQNCHSVTPKTASASGFRGVFFRPGRPGTWMVRIRIERRLVCLGEFKDPIAGAKAYDKAARRAFGKFALTNKKLGLL
jgi:HNH endonuclease